MRGEFTSTIGSGFFLGVFWLQIKFVTSSFQIFYFFLIQLWKIGSRNSFFLGCLIYWHITFHSSLIILCIFVVLVVFFSFLFLSDFVSSFFLQNLAKGLSILSSERISSWFHWYFLFCYISLISALLFPAFHKPQICSFSSSLGMLD